MQKMHLLLCTLEQGCVVHRQVFEHSNPNNFIYVPSEDDKEWYDDCAWYTPVVVNDEELREGDYFVDMCQLRLDHVFKVTGTQSYIDFLNSRRIANNEFVGDESTRRQLCKVESIANLYFNVNQLVDSDIVWFLEERVKNSVN